MEDVTENTNFKFYLTAAIPTSLYRFSKDPGDLGSGPLALNFGVLSRLTWLDTDGHEGLVGLEAGLMGMGLATDKDRQLAIVMGMGLGVPLGNVNQPTQASVNIHAWLAYTVGNRIGDAERSGQQPTHCRHGEVEPVGIRVRPEHHHRQRRHLPVTERDLRPNARPRLAAPGDSGNISPNPRVGSERVETNHSERNRKKESR